MPKDKIANIIYINGNIYTVNDNMKKASAIVIEDDTIIYVGNDKDALSLSNDTTQVINLNGKTVLPGLIEGHMHMDNLGQSLRMINAFGKAKEDILRMVADQVATAGKGEWIEGRGWNNILWEDNVYPSKEELDAVAPNNPVALTRADAHMVWVNSKALEIAGINKNTKNPQGGEILRNSNGELLGCLTDTAAYLVKSLIPQLSVEKQKQALLLAQEQLLSYGLTSVFDAGINLMQLKNYEELYASQSLKVRVYPLIIIKTIDSPEFNYLINNKPTGQLFKKHMSIGCAKIIGDGSLGARSAAMLEEYSDRANHFGNLRFEDEELYNIIKPIYNAGYQIAFHAIGDATNHQGINIFEKVIKENPRENHRLRIEHFQIITADDIDRAINFKIIPAMQTTHAISDMLMAEDRIGKKRMKTAYAWRTIIDKGSIIVGGSDAPVELVNPYHSLHAAITRKNKDGYPENGWHNEEKMTREEALKTFTIWAAYGQFEEDIKGSIEIGKLADFVVIDRDYMECDEKDIRDIEVLLTVIGGEIVYKK